MSGYDEWNQGEGTQYGDWPSQQGPNTAPQPQQQFAGNSAGGAPRQAGWQGQSSWQGQPSWQEQPGNGFAAPAAPTPAPQRNGWKTALLSILGLFVVAGLGFGAYKLYTSSNSDAQNAAEAEESTTTNVPAPSPETVTVHATQTEVRTRVEAAPEAREPAHRSYPDGYTGVPGLSSTGFAGTPNGTCGASDSLEFAGSNGSDFVIICNDNGARYYRSNIGGTTFESDSVTREGPGSYEVDASPSTFYVDRSGVDVRSSGGSLQSRIDFSNSTSD